MNLQDQFDKSYFALKEDVGAIWIERDFIKVSGKDSSSYLQGQLTQNIDSVQIGKSVLSFILEPQGKVNALVRLTKTDEQQWLLDINKGFGQGVVDRLCKYKLRMKLQIELLDWKCLGIRGPKSIEFRSKDAKDSEIYTLDSSLRTIEGFDLVGRDVAEPQDIAMCDPLAWDALRIEAGIPNMGSELNEKTIPAEAEINDLAVSFTKGCYTGQELVARIDSRGNNVPKKLRGIIIDSTLEVPIGAVVNFEGKKVGTISSSSYSCQKQKYVGLAYLKRDVPPMAEIVVTWEDEQAFAVSTTVPF